MQFVYISNQVAIATGVLTSMICYVPKKQAGAPRLPSASREAIPADPSSASAASSHPASGDYVALSTLADGEKEPDSISNGLARSRGDGFWVKAGRFLATDLRVRFAAIFVGLWALNLVCESLPYFTGPRQREWELTSGTSFEQTLLP